MGRRRFELKLPSPIEWVESVAKSLVDQPDKVVSRWLEAEKTVELAVVPGDRGKIIGRRGKTIDSLRILASALFAEPNERIDVRLREE